MCLRLSGFASKQLTEGNPDFTDLSDKNRPTKIAEMFHNIYDEEWTTALEALTHVKKGSEPRTEEQAIKLLMEIIKVWAPVLRPIWVHTCMMIAKQLEEIKIKQLQVNGKAVDY